MTLHSFFSTVTKLEIRFDGSVSLKARKEHCNSLWKNETLPFKASKASVSAFDEL